MSLYSRRFHSLIRSFTSRYTWSSWTQGRHWESAYGHPNSKVNTQIQTTFQVGGSLVGRGEGHGPELLYGKKPESRYRGKGRDVHSPHEPIVPVPDSRGAMQGSTNGSLESKRLIHWKPYNIFERKKSHVIEMTYHIHRMGHIVCWPSYTPKSDVHVYWNHSQTPKSFLEKWSTKFQNTKTYGTPKKPKETNFKINHFGTFRLPEFKTGKKSTAV